MRTFFQVDFYRKRENRLVAEREVGIAPPGIPLNIRHSIYTRKLFADVYIYEEGGEKSVVPLLALTLIAVAFR